MYTKILETNTVKYLKATSNKVDSKKIMMDYLNDYINEFINVINYAVRK